MKTPSTRELIESLIGMEESLKQAMAGIPKAFTTKLAKQLKAVATARQTFENIEQLTATQGNLMTLETEGTDFNGQPNNIVEIQADFTDWVTRYYTGENLIDALQQAANAKQLRQESRPKE